MNTPLPFAARLEKLRSTMTQAKAEVFICDHAEMLAWLTGYTVSETRYRACIVPRQGEPVWVLRTIDVTPCRKSTWVADIRSFSDDADPFAAIAAVIAQFGANRIAADYNSYGFTAHALRTLQAALPEAQWIDLNGISDRLRAVKDAVEIEQLRAAAAIADGAMAKLVAAVQPGMRPRDVAAIAAAYYLQNGAGDWWVGPISISRRGDNHHSNIDIDFLHQMLVDEVLALGDVLHVELVPRVGNYSARMMRSICIGTPTSNMITTMNRLVALQDRQIASMQPGALSSTVDASLRQPLLAEKLRTRYTNVSGYQIGLYARTPRSSDFSYCFHPAADWSLQAGMTFHMYVSAQGLALSDSVLVTDSGPLRLTQTERGLL